MHHVLQASPGQASRDLVTCLSGKGYKLTAHNVVQVNKIRQSLRLIAQNSTAFGLHQPHMERTKLCDLPDDQLDEQYVRQRTALRDLIWQLAKPKRVNGRVMTGPGLADLVEQMVTALNARDIPTAGSILEHFNKELVYRSAPKVYA